MCDHSPKLIRRVCEQWAFQRIPSQEEAARKYCTYIIKKKPRPIKKFYVLHYIFTNIFSGIVVVASPPFLLTHFPHSYVVVKIIITTILV